MFWFGFWSSAVLGAAFGLWSLGFADWLRCRAVGIPDKREAQVCPLFVGNGAWKRIPWEKLAFSDVDRSQAWSVAIIGCFLWMFAWSRFAESGSIGAWVWNLSFFSGLLIVSILDLRWRVLPIEPMLVAALFLGMGRYFLGAPISQILIGAMSLGIFFGLQALLSRGRWLGAGDPVLAFTLGAALGWPRAAVLVYATYMAVIPLLSIHVLRFRTWQRVRWPFGPLLAFGAFIAWGWGDGIWMWLTAWMR